LWRRYPSARVALAHPRPNPKAVASVSASGIPRHLSKRMVYPLLGFHETLLECLESSERRACPSSPSRGQHDQPRPSRTGSVRAGPVGVEPTDHPPRSDRIRADPTRGTLDPGAEMSVGGRGAAADSVRDLALSLTIGPRPTGSRPKHPTALQNGPVPRYRPRDRSNFRRPPRGLEIVVSGQWSVKTEEENGPD
jgi:hypothetical protein